MKVKNLLEILNTADPEAEVIVNVRDRIFNLDDVSKTSVNEWYKKYAIDRSVPSEDDIGFLEVLALGHNNLGLPRIPKREGEDRGDLKPEEA